MTRIAMILPLLATLAGCETTEGFVSDVENATQAVID